MTKKVIGQLKERFLGKKVLIIGLGLQGGGVGLVRFFTELGAKITVTDLKNEEQLEESIEKIKDLDIKLILGKHRLKDFIEADFIFKGPSVPWTLPELILAQKRGIPVEMELSFFVSNCPAKIIGVTGTRGKSTTTNLIYQVLKKAGFSVYLGGGLPGVSTINFLKKITTDNWIVMELSSWALSGFHRKKISPHIAVFTNFYSDHLNYYKELNQYLFDKKAIYLYQKINDSLIINKRLKHIVEVDKPESQLIYFETEDFPRSLIRLKGSYNLENAAAALKVAKILKIAEKKAINTISSFKGLPFRQEVIGKKNNVVFINDTTSTTPIATIKALETFYDKQIYLILGGNSKNLPYNQLINQLGIVKKIILLKGSFTDEIINVLKERYPEKLTKSFSNLERAVDFSYNLARKEKEKIYLLFSPAATSFAMFKNEFDRGKEFNRIIGEL